MLNGEGALSGAQGAGADVFVAADTDSWWAVHLLGVIYIPLSGGRGGGSGGDELLSLRSANFPGRPTWRPTMQSSETSESAAPLHRRVAAPFSDGTDIGTGFLLTFSTVGVAGVNHGSAPSPQVREPGLGTQLYLTRAELPTLAAAAGLSEHDFS